MSKRFPMWMILAAFLAAPLHAQEEEPVPEPTEQEPTEEEPTEEVVEERLR